MSKDFEEFDPYYQKIGMAHYVENDDAIVYQASNGHIQVWDKKCNRMTMHITCIGMVSDAELKRYLPIKKPVAAAN